MRDFGYMCSTFVLKVFNQKHHIYVDAYTCRLSTTTVLMEQFDNLSSQYRHLEIRMKKFDAEKLFIDKMEAM